MTRFRLCCLRTGVVFKVNNSGRKVLMIDAFSTLHVGNGALIDNTYKLCKEYFGEPEVLSIDVSTNAGRFPVVIEDVFSGYGGTFISKLKFMLTLCAFVGFESVNELLFRGYFRFHRRGRYGLLVDAIERSDICVSLSGETINDFYRPHMYLRLFTYYLAILKGKKFVVFPQSIGPVFRPLTKFLLRKVLGRACAIFARDQASYDLAVNLWKGSPVKVIFCPDVATTQESDPVALPVQHDVKKVIGVTVSDIPREEMGFQGDYLPALVDGISAAVDREQYQILMMPSNYKHAGVSSDYKACMDAKLMLEQRSYVVSILANEIVHPDVYQGMQKNLFAFVSTRMHVGILATSAGVPTLMINTQHKIRSYMSLMEMDDFVLELSSLTDVAEKVSALLDQNIILREKLVANNKRLREQVGAAMSSLAESL